MGKIKTSSQIKKIVNTLKKRGKRIAFTNGCFDVLHPGHIKVLREAKKRADILIVGLNSDRSVKKIKDERRPILDENARKCILEAIEYVDYIVVFSENTPHKLIQEIKPDYLVKGGDWRHDAIIGREFVKKVFRVKLQGEYSTTKIIEKIKNQK
ncbi:MAG: adenylyltransferase/cytidyltransferase family protein [Candidatus Omnitrophota bacterium]|nr:MAG: adenylyltransferase/cytidyltransferase family protein [Candidatus Omnitrophota bacterium]